MKFACYEPTEAESHRKKRRKEEESSECGIARSKTKGVFKVHQKRAGVLKFVRGRGAPFPTADA